MSKQVQIKDLAYRLRALPPSSTILRAALQEQLNTLRKGQ